MGYHRKRANVSHNFNKNLKIHRLLYSETESYIIRPGQPWPAENDEMNASCELTEEMLRSPGKFFLAFLLSLALEEEYSSFSDGTIEFSRQL